MFNQLTRNISSGTIESGIKGWFWGKYTSDRLCVSIDNKIVKIAIEILPQNTRKEDVKFNFWRSQTNWIYAKIGGQSILINQKSAISRFGKEKIDETDVEKAIKEVATYETAIPGISSWELFSNPKFTIDGVTPDQLRNLRNYILKNYLTLSKSENLTVDGIVPNRSLKLTGNNTYYLIDNQMTKKSDTEVVFYGICLNDGEEIKQPIKRPSCKATSRFNFSPKRILRYLIGSKSKTTSSTQAEKINSPACQNNVIQATSLSPKLTQLVGTYNTKINSLISNALYWTDRESYNELKKMEESLFEIRSKDDALYAIIYPKNEPPVKGDRWFRLTDKGDNHFELKADSDFVFQFHFNLDEKKNPISAAGSCYCDSEGKSPDFFTVTKTN